MIVHIFMDWDPDSCSSSVFIGSTKLEAATKYVECCYGEHDKVQALAYAMDKNGPFSLWPKCTLVYETQELNAGPE